MALAYLYKIDQLLSCPTKEKQGKQGKVEPTFFRRIDKNLRRKEEKQ